MVLSATLLLLMAGAWTFGATPSASTRRPAIVALGDSLTSGHGIGAARAFPAVIQEKLTAAGYDFTVVNAGVSGDTSSQAVRRYQTALDDDVRIMILALGVNDGLRGLPIADLRRNLAAIIEHAQSRKIAVLLCGMEALPIYGWKYTLDFHQMYVELARTYDVPLVPFMMLNVLGKPELLQPDRVHPNAAGARVMAEHVWPYLAALLERVGASRVSV
jgi:acyl-CoA thioesterase-1